MLVRSDLKEQGFGALLMHKLIRYCRERGTGQLWGSIMCDNAPMLRLARALGFTVRSSEANIEQVVLDLQSAPGAAGERAAD